MASRLTHDRQVLALALLGGVPAAVTALWLVWSGPGSQSLRWLLTAVIVGAWGGFAVAVRERVVRPLRTVSGLLAALREGDFSIQARGADREDALGEVMCELNGLIETMREQRLGALEATALLRTVMEEINLAVFAFDDHQRLRLANRAGEKLLAQPVERVLGRTARELGLVECLEGEPARTFQAAFPGGLGRWGMRRSSFRQGGLPHQLLVLADLSQALRGSRGARALPLPLRLAVRLRLRRSDLLFSLGLIELRQLLVPFRGFFRLASGFVELREAL